MTLLGPIKRLLTRRQSYKPVAPPGTRRDSDSAPSDVNDDDSDPYMEDDELSHGSFVYCAFLMLGTIFFTGCLIIGLAMLLRMVIFGDVNE